MKTFAVLLLVLTLTGSCSHNSPEGTTRSGETDSPAVNEGTSRIEFRELRYDFGTVKQGEKLAYTFIYKNTGDAPLIIYSSKADCGCTVPEYDSKPLAPGMEGKMKVVFDTQGFSGYQTKTIQLLTNAENAMVTLALRAVIE